MNKQSSLSGVSERKKVLAVSVLAIFLALANIAPLHHSEQRKCTQGTSYTVHSTTFGLPVAYFQTWEGGRDGCTGYYGSEPSRVFSAQALLTDALVFGVIMVGLNVLVDRRTKA